MDANRDSSLATDDELLQAQAELWNHVFAYTKSMSLRCAVELGIPDAIHRRGGSITVPDLVAELSLPPSRTPYLRRLMRLLAHAGFFDAGPAPDAYGLTLLSRLLVSAPGAGQGLSPFALAMLHPIIVSPSMSLAAWFRAADDAARVPFATAHGGREFYAVVKENPEFGAAFNEAMACDGRFVMDLIVRGHGQDLFRGIASLVDVGGGSGAAARAIAAAFPHWILHGWGDEECVKILRRCREALPAGGRVIVMDLVVGSSPADARATETQLLWDVMMMGVVGSPERDEGEWRKIFDDAGFSGYKILAILGIRSVIEVYP
ncbi:unnamed protein product [Triticum turgidum subsp. durum]|uniref:O-methyltransferase ZRP4 n=1 Tax=Triticum turgidum subsp. durum TaxID=4567 RepID=A0A9R1QLT8_TRITD|nr:unnamed protein product [Triticum turgidum subsp. durum]